MGARLLGLIFAAAVLGTGCEQVTSAAEPEEKGEQLPEFVPVGAHDVTVLALALTHPGPTTVGAVRCDSLRLQLRDAVPRVDGVHLEVRRVYVVTRAGELVVQVMIP